MRIVTRLRIVATVTVVAWIVLMPILIWSMLEFRNARNDLALADEIKANFFRRAEFRDQYFLYREDRLRANWENNKAISDRLLRQARVQFHRAEDLQALERLGGLIEGTAHIFHRVIANTEALKAAVDNLSVYQELDKKLYSQLLLKAYDVRDQANALQDAAELRVEQTYQDLTLFTGLFALTLTLLTLMTSVRVAVQVSRRLLPLLRGAEIIAGGDLDHRIAAQGGDEFTDLAFALNAMTDKLQTNTKRLEAEIIERERVASTLAESEQRFRTMADSAPVLIWMAGPDKSCFYFNKVWQEFTGRSLEQEMGNCWAEGVHPEDYQRCLDTYVSAFDARQSFVMEYRLRRFDGEYRWIVDNGVPRFDDRGLFLGYIGSCIDITERKQAEADRSRLLKIIDEASDFISMSDMQGHLKYLNVAGARLVGLPDDVDLAPLEIKDMHPEWATKRVLEVGIPTALRQGHWQGETALLHRDGHETPVSQMLLLHRDEAGNAEYLSTIMRDISEMKNTQRKLELAKQAAEAANLTKSRFLATMSHELRTPMNGILGMAQMLLMPTLEDSERQDYARIVLTSGQTLLALLNDILDLSKVEAGKFVLESAPFEAGQVIQETVSLFAETAKRKGLRFEFEWSGPSDQCYLGDPNRLRQMLSNLVGNALKFTAQGHVRTEVREVMRAGSTATLEFSVSDSGVGVPKDKSSLLFQPFSQVDSTTTRRYGGTGLGLSIVRALARLMDGEAGVESEVGQGSRFWFRIRVGLIADQHSRPMERGHHEATGQASATARFVGHVLAVEDDPANRKVIQALLRALGLTVAFAEDGAKGLEAVLRGDPADLIFMDVQMPVMDGYEATRRIRLWERETGHSRHPIVALTAAAFPEDRRLCLEAGMDDVVTKPLASMAALTGALRRWLPAGAEMPAAAATPITRSVDVARFLAIFHELEPLLEQNKFGAIVCFKALQEVAADTEVVDELTEARWLIDEFHFDQALARLHRIVADHGWETP